MKILMCSDGSKQAQEATRFGGIIAAASQAEVTILGIMERPGHQEALFDSLRVVQQDLNAAGVTAEVTIKAGNPVEEILKKTQETHFDMVIIGAVRKGSRGPFLMSATAYKIIKVIEPPVLVVVGARQSLGSILICSGGERYIERAVALAGGMAKAAGAGITLLHVMAEPPTVYADLIELEKENAAHLLETNSDLGRNLRHEKESLESIGVKCEVRLRYGLVVDEIYNEILMGDYDLIVTGSSPAGDALRTYIMGNITREIVNRAERPVLVVRGEDVPVGLRRGLKDMLSDLGHALGGRSK
ncbi:MAG TPA: universal stress protein [Blastocatellia bacterium]|nr:universal stress protein [Blastocatellia bacterium]